MVMGLSTANRLGEQWRQVEQRAARAEADKAQAEAGKALAELSVLKAQIHPHFLFNTLNNLYSLAVTESQHTAPAILKLSNLMRYVTDEVNQDLVPLQHEIDCIRDYIDLQRLRLSQKTKVEVEIVGEVAGKKIAPLLLIPFVENVFKYGVSNHEPSVIVIRLRAEAQAIIFFCQNTVFPAPRPAERMGVGIANTRQRLVHLYPGRHTLEITQDSSLFTVQLTLEG
jgi:LytS/YehU family sensor histidine kinase